MTERELCIAFNMISGVGSCRYRAIRDILGEPDDIRELERGDLLKIEGIGKILAERIVSFDWDAALAREIGIAERGKVEIVTLNDESYPEYLREIYDPPLCLYIRGQIPCEMKHSIAIVGSRRVSAYGIKTARQFAADAAAAGFAVVSGLAQGVDSLVHQEVVDVSGVTVGVIGGGLMHMYPRENVPLARAMIAAGGGVISEFPLDCHINRHNFPRRNRIVAGLCCGTIVIEAGEDSGALITAKLASEMGREVFAVPGRVDNPQARGCHQLIKNGAYLVENFADAASILDSGLRPEEMEEAQRSIVSPAFLDKDCARVYEVLQRGDSDIEGLQLATGMEAGELLAILMKLELKLLVERDAEFFYRLTGVTHK